jgi:hypothetical protein
MKAAISGFRVLAMALGATLCGCSSSEDEECVRRYLTEAREQWCFAERTMNDEVHEPLQPR